MIARPCWQPFVAKPSCPTIIPPPGWSGLHRQGRLRGVAGDATAYSHEQALEEGVVDIDLDIRIRSVLDSASKESRGVIKQFGQVCGIAAALLGCHASGAAISR